VKTAQYAANRCRAATYENLQARSVFFDRESWVSGAFPVYSYMYTLRQFMRMNAVSKQDVEQFVVALSSNNLSVREIEQLAHG